jgi:mRNA interferase RelE/StbE
MTKSFSLRIGKPAVKFLKNSPLKDFKQVMFKIISLQSNSCPQVCKALNGFSGGDRVDQGEYRILYTSEDDTISIFRVGKRNNDEVC